MSGIEHTMQAYVHASAALLEPVSYTHLRAHET